MAPAPDWEKALELALAQIDKQHGKGSVMRLGAEGRAAQGESDGHTAYKID